VQLTGTLRVNLPTDIIQLFGPKSVPVIVFGSVLAVFELGERLAAQRAKDALSKWLLTFDVQKAKALPEGTQELFERIFGERHFSWKCFVRSAAFSLGAIALISIVCLLINPHASEVFYPVAEDWLRELSPFGYAWIFVTFMLLWSIVIDYISLFKTRLVLGLLLRMHRRPMIVALVILAVDFIVYKIIFMVGAALSQMVPLLIWGSLTTEVSGTLNRFLELAIFEFYSTWPFGLSFVLFWAGFAPSLWMWLYVLALFVTRGLLRSEKLVNSLRWFLDVEKNPFRSIGAVAATLAFIASVAIILVSAEYSRISAAL
jgi:hypothetical protein